MPCETKLRQGQTLRARIDEIRERMKNVEAGLALGRIKATVGKQGAIAFAGLSAEERAGMTDGCIYRRIMSASGSAVARMAIQRAETAAGRTVDKLAIGQGVHSHDGGAHWHPKG